MRAPLLSLLSLAAACSPPAPSAPPSSPGASTSTAAPEPPPPAPSTPACASAEELRASVPGLLAQGRLRRSLKAIDEADALCPEAAPRGLPARLRVVAELGLHEQTSELLPRAEALGSAESKEAAAFAREWLSKSQPPASQWTQRNPADVDESKAAARKARAEAQEAARGGQWARVREKYVEAWQSDRSDFEALAMAAQAARQGGQEAEARRLGDRAMIGLERASGKAAVAEAPNGFGQASEVKVSPDGARMAVIDGLEVRLVDLSTSRVVQPLQGHTDKIHGVAFSPDSKILASCSGDHSVRLWDAWTGEPLGLLKDNSHLYGLAFSPDGGALATVRYSKISVWDLGEKKIARELTLDPEQAKATGFMPGGGALWVATTNGAVRLWDLASGKPTRTVLGVAGEANAAAVSPDGKTLAVGGIDRGLDLWEMAAGKQLLSDKGYTTGNSTVAFSPDGKTFAAILGMEIKVWDVASKKLSLSNRVDHRTKSLAFSSDGGSLFVGDEAGEVKEFSLGPWKLTHSHRGHSSAGGEASLSRDGKALALALDDGGMRVWDLAGPALRTLQGHQGQVRGMALSPDGRSLVSAGNDRAMLQGVGPAPRAPEALAGWSWASAYSPDGKRVVVGATQSLKVWDATTAQPLLALDGKTDARLLLFSPDGSAIASSPRDRSVRVWDAATGKQRHALQGSASSIDAMAYSPDSKILAAGGQDGAVALWEASSGKLLRTLNGGKWVRGLAFSQDGKALATLDFLEKVRVWEVSSGKLLRDLPARVSGGVAFSPDGKTVVSGALGDAVRIWEVATGKPLLALQGHTEQVEQVFFLPGGRRLITVDAKVTRVWDTASGALLVTLAAVRGAPAGYALAPSGRIEFFGDQPQRAREHAVCRVGARLYPFWMCEESVEAPGLLAKVMAAEAPRIML